METLTFGTYRLYKYDVWGNAEDGYEVNDIFVTADTATLPDDGDKALLMRWLHKAGLCPDGAGAYAFEFPDEDTIVVSQASDGMPLGEFRREGTVQDATR